VAFFSGLLKAPKGDGGHRCPCPLLAISTLLKRVIAMTATVILALAFAITTGIALTTAFGFGLLPLGIY
jgi:hypothetical protein